MKLGLDIGSTTIKCVVLDDENKLIYSTYERHYSRITEKIAEILALVRTRIDGVENASVALSGSAVCSLDTQLKSLRDSLKMLAM